MARGRRSLRLRAEQEMVRGEQCGIHPGDRTQALNNLAPEVRDLFEGTRSVEPDAFALRCFLRRWSGDAGTVARRGGPGCLGEVFPFLGLAQPGPTRFGVQRRLLSADRAQRTIVPDFLRRSRPYGSCHDGLTPSTTPSSASSFFDGQEFSASLRALVGIICQVGGFFRADAQGMHDFVEI